MSLPPYRVRGQGPLVVLVHGTAPDLFDRLESELLPTHRVARLARRGFPGSGLPVVRELGPHVDDLAELIQREGGRATVVGWSVGGILAVELLQRAPERVDGLVLIEPPWLAKRSPTLRMLAGILIGKLLGAFGRAGAGGERFLRWALSRRDGVNELDVLSSADRERVRAAGEAMLAELDGGTGEHLAGRVAAARVPVALLAGDQSTPEFGRAAARLGQALGVEPRVIPGAGHLMQETHAREVAQVLRGLSAREGEAARAAGR